MSSAPQVFTVTVRPGVKTLAQRGRQISRLVLWCLLFASFTHACGLFAPVMPDQVGEESWGYALNQAVAQDLTFGKDIIFTYGPYASVYTHIYHPATVRIMTFGILLLIVLYVGCFAWLVKDAQWNWLLIMAAILLMQFGIEDSLLYAGPLLVCLVLCKLQFPGRQEAFAAAKNRSLIVLAFAFLGLLPLIKGTFAALVAATCLLSALFLVANRRWRLALFCLLAPGVSMAGLWVISGQHLTALPGFFVSMGFIASGYSEAVAIDGSLWETFLFILPATAVLGYICLKQGLATSQRFFLLLVYALFLFVAFKEGFVRQDESHITVAMNALAIGTIALSLLNCNGKFAFDHRKLLALALLPPLVPLQNQWRENFRGEVEAASTSITLPNQIDSRWARLEHLRERSGTPRLMEMVLAAEPVNPGLVLYGWNFKVRDWKRELEQSLHELNQKSKLDFALSGTTDIYTFDESGFWARDYQWNPRPVLQSYSAYTPELIDLDAQHLRSGGAPDNLLIRLDPLDDHLPSLEDGLSWSAMLDNYSAAGFRNDWVHLAKKPLPLRTTSRYIVVGKITAVMGEQISVPAANGPVFAEVDAQPSILGRLLAIAYKVPPLNLTVIRSNGAEFQFGVVANMMHTGFLLSPLVITDADFLDLFAPQRPPTGANRVRQMELNVAGGPAICWRKTYSITFKQYQYSSDVP